MEDQGTAVAMATSKQGTVLDTLMDEIEGLVRSVAPKGASIEINFNDYGRSIEFRNCTCTDDETD